MYITQFQARAGLQTKSSLKCIVFFLVFSKGTYGFLAG